MKKIALIIIGIILTSDGFAKCPTTDLVGTYKAVPICDEIESQHYHLKSVEIKETNENEISIQFYEDENFHRMSLFVHADSDLSSQVKCSDEPEHKSYQWFPSQLHDNSWGITWLSDYGARTNYGGCTYRLAKEL